MDPPVTSSEMEVGSIEIDNEVTLQTSNDSIASDASSARFEEAVEIDHTFENGSEDPLVMDLSEWASTVYSHSTSSYFVQDLKVLIRQFPFLSVNEECPISGLSLFLSIGSPLEVSFNVFMF